MPIMELIFYTQKVQVQGRRGSLPSEYIYDDPMVMKKVGYLVLVEVLQKREIAYR